MYLKILFRLPIILMLLFLVAGCDSSKPKKELIIFHAGSLTVPVKDISIAFQEKYPDVIVLTEAAGSVACARKITDLNRKCDVMLSADYTVIDKFLIPEYGTWNIKFAANEMVIAFMDKSEYAHNIDAENWMDILLDEEVNYGRSDPNSDPCGYRTVLCAQLAEDFYNYDSLSYLLLKKDRRFIRPKETDLIALLETRVLDYIFIYRSVAVQHNLNFIPLPDSVNLKRPELSQWYAGSTVEINGKKPGKKILQKGEPMIYGLTIPNNAPNPDLALAFTTFILQQNEGIKILEDNGQPSLIPSLTSSWNNIPSELKKFALPDN